MNGAASSSLASDGDKKDVSLCWELLASSFMMCANWQEKASTRKEQGGSVVAVFADPADPVRFGAIEIRAD